MITSLNLSGIQSEEHTKYLKFLQNHCNTDLETRREHRSPLHFENENTSSRKLGNFLLQ